MRLAARALAWALACAATTAGAAGQALLVAVSSYPHLPGRNLPGAANDLALMNRVVASLGVAPERVLRLAESSEPGTALPTRAGILAALAGVAERARAGEWVLVYFAGHGAQVPARPPSREKDGLDEVFLPRDTRTWDPARAEVQGALRDKDIAAALHRIQARGAHVWAVFDTCHAADMARRPLLPGQGEWRRASPQELRIPLPLWLSGWRLTQGSAATSLRATPTARHAGWGRFVGFFATQEGDGELEELLPDPQAPGQRRVYGLFTYRLAEAVAQWRGGSFDALADLVRRGYADRPFPVPQFSGALDSRPDFGP